MELLVAYYLTYISKVLFIYHEACRSASIIKITKYTFHPQCFSKHRNTWNTLIEEASNVSILFQIPKIYKFIQKVNTKNTH